MAMKMLPFILAATVLASSAAAQTNAPAAAPPLPKLNVTSTAFKDGAMIPLPYTCHGVNISPSLSWDAGPPGTETYVLICEDPDSTYKPFTHWVMWNIPKDARTLPEKVPAIAQLTNGAQQGMNDFKKVGYRGPCPPSGVHRYYFKVYALNTTLLVLDTLDKTLLLEKIKGKVIAEGALMGRYGR